MAFALASFENNFGPKRPSFNEERVLQRLSVVPLQITDIILFSNEKGWSPPRLEAHVKSCWTEGYFCIVQTKGIFHHRDLFYLCSWFIVPFWDSTHSGPHDATGLLSETQLLVPTLSSKGKKQLGKLVLTEYAWNGGSTSHQPMTQATNLSLLSFLYPAYQGRWEATKYPCPHAN